MMRHYLAFLTLAAFAGQAVLRSPLRLTLSFGCRRTAPVVPLIRFAGRKPCHSKPGGGKGTLRSYGMTLVLRFPAHNLCLGYGQ